MKEIAQLTEIAEGALTKVTHGGQTYLATKVDGEYYAIENRCSHLGWSLARGEVRGDTITCPWHGSCFDIRTGQNRDWVNAFAGLRMPRWTRSLIALGKSPKPITTHKLVVDGEAVYLP